MNISDNQIDRLYNIIFDISNDDIIQRSEDLFDISLIGEKKEIFNDFYSFSSYLMFEYIIFRDIHTQHLILPGRIVVDMLMVLISLCTIPIAFTEGLISCPLYDNSFTSGLVTIMIALYTISCFLHFGACQQYFKINLRTIS